MVNPVRYDCFTCKARTCSILNSCGKDALRAISTNKVSKTLVKGENLFSEGELKRGISFIKKGFLKVELNGKTGRSLILRIAGKGSVFGHRINPDHMFYPYTVKAVSDVEYCFVSYNQFKEISGKNILLRQQLVNLFLEELEMAEKRALYLAHKTVRQKVGEALLILAESYEYKEGSPSFKIAMGRQDIADLAGTTKEQVSKILKEFEKEGHIRFTAKKFSYLNIPMLKNISTI